MYITPSLYSEDYLCVFPGFSKVVGPLLVDTTPPRFVGSVSVHSEEGYLIAEWEDRSFLEDIDTDLRYQVGIGKSCSDGQGIVKN